MKIGILACGRDFAKEAPKVFEAWKAVKKENQDFELIVSGVHACFSEWHELGQPILSTDNSHDLLQDELFCCSSILGTPLSEAEARNQALYPLLDLGCDYIWLLDLSDEFYTVENIKKIFNYVLKYKDFCHIFKINFKNYFQTEDQWISGFCPPRIWEVNIKDEFDKYRISHFSWDNDVIYTDSKGAEFSDKRFPAKEIPKFIAHVKHHSWLSNERSKLKVQYQNLHFKGICSYIWNEAENKIEFNKDYYIKNRIPIPIINKD